MNLESYLRGGRLGEVVGDLSRGAHLHWSGPAPPRTAGVDQDQEETSGTVPTGIAALRSLPRIKVTSYDIQQNENTECVICLEELVLGEPATRIPCGHLFHETCVKKWLHKSNQCPVCRYELQTDNAEYEQGRRERMARRKLRLRRRDLAVKTPQELRRLAEHLAIDSTGCLEKEELVERIVSSGCITIVAEEVSGLGKTQVLSERQLASMSVRELKKEMAKAGVSSQGCIEKSDFWERLRESGCVHPPRQLASLSVRELKEQLAHVGINPEGCLEKEELMERLRQSGGEWTYESTPASNGFMGAPVMEEARAAHCEGLLGGVFGEDKASSTPEVGMRGNCSDFSAAELSEVQPSLENHCIAELRRIAARIGVSLDGCLEKAEIIQSIRSMLKEHSLSDHSVPWELRSVRELRSIAVQLGVSLDGCLEKAEILQRIKSFLGQCPRIGANVAQEESDRAHEFDSLDAFMRCQALR